MLRNCGQKASKLLVEKIYHRFVTTSTKLLEPEHQFSRLLPGPERIRVSTLLNEDNVLLVDSAGCGTTAYEIFHQGWKTSNNGQCLGTRNKETGNYEWIKYEETWDRALSVGSGLQELGLVPGPSSIVGINCRNRTEYVLSYLGISAYSSVFVPLYDHLNDDAVNHIVSNIESPLFIVDSESKALHLIRHKRQKFPFLKHLVVTFPFSRQLAEEAKTNGLEMITFETLEKLGERNRKPLMIPKPEDLFTICWTSGTSGTPKGVPISHRNFAVTINSAIEISKSLNIERAVVISYMPTGHAYEIAIQLQTMAKGGSIGFYGGDIFKLMEDIKALQPDLIPVVPRLLNRIHSMVLASVENKPIKKRLLLLALHRKEKLLKKGIVSTTTIWDKLVLKKIREIFGGKIRLMSSSGAPLDPKVKMFFRCALGCYFFNGYGQTETNGVALTHVQDLDTDSVGAPLPSCQVKLVDVPEMEYYAREDIGEICVRGPNTIKGYYKNPEANKETIREDGWVYSGDIGKWLPDGTLQIVDRKTNLFKLSQGEYLSPDKIENVYVRYPLVAQIYVDGLSSKDYLVAIAVPDAPVFLSWAKNNGFPSNATMEELCNDQEVRRQMLQRLQKFGKNAGLTSLEHIKNVHLHPTLWSIEDGFLTPTLKMKRNVLKKHFRGVIENLYQEGLLHPAGQKNKNRTNLV